MPATAQCGAAPTRSPPRGFFSERSQPAADCGSVCCRDGLRVRTQSADSRSFGMVSMTRGCLESSSNRRRSSEIARVRTSSLTAVSGQADWISRFFGYDVSGPRGQAHKHLHYLRLEANRAVGPGDAVERRLDVVVLADSKRVLILQRADHSTRLFLRQVTRPARTSGCPGANRHERPLETSQKRDQCRLRLRPAIWSRTPARESGPCSRPADSSPFARNRREPRLVEQLFSDTIDASCKRRGGTTTRAAKGIL